MNPWDADPIVESGTKAGPVVRIPPSAKSPEDQRVAILQDEWHRARTPEDRQALERELRSVGGAPPRQSASAAPARGPWDDDPIGAAPVPKAREATAPDPTEGMTTMDLVRAGAGKWLSDTAHGVKQRWDQGAAFLERTVPGGKSLSQAVGGTTAEQALKDTQAAIDESKRLDAPLMRRPAAVAGNIASGAAVTAPITARMSPLASGAVMGAISPTASDESLAVNVAAGAAGGWVGDKVVKGLARVIRPETRAQVKSLADAGVPMTPGQILGGMANRIEEKATSIPIVGDAIAKARGRSIEGLNRAVADRVLEPLGQKLPDDIPAGRDAVAYVTRSISDHYDRTLVGVTVKADAAFARDVQALAGNVLNGNLPPQQAQQFGQILQDQVLGRFMGQNALTGRTFKDMESNLGRLASDYSASADAGQRQLGGAVRELQAQLRELVVRTNPGKAKDLAAANSAWANLIRMQKAGSYAGADDGIFSPGQLQRAVRAADKSRNKGAFARGDARMQDISDAGKSVLGDKVPDSGTASRVMNATVLGTGAVLAPKTLAAGLAASIPYTRRGGALVQKSLIDRPEAAGAIAEGVRGLAPAATSAGALGGQYLLDDPGTGRPIPAYEYDTAAEMPPPAPRSRPPLSSFELS